MKAPRNTKLWTILATFLMLALITPAAFAQQKQDTELNRQHRMNGPMKNRGKIMKELIPPRMLLKHADTLGLTDAQRTEIQRIAETSRANSEKLQAELQAETEKLTPLLAATQPDPTATLRQADRVFEAETKLKRARLESMLQTKNTLTPDQITQIQALRKDRPHKGHRGKHKPHREHKEQAR